MKKLMCLVLTMAMVMATGVNAAAEVTVSANTETTVSANTPVAVSENAPAALDVTPITATDTKPLLALGADLSQEQLVTVLGLMGIQAADLGNYQVIYITNADEKQYLGNYVDASVIGTRSLSSVLIVPTSEGSGVVVSSKNINYCTTDMYRSALLTAGVKNANIIVAAPTPISGTAALIGALKGYEQMTGTTVAEQAIDTAMNELVVTGELSQAVGSSDDAQELITYIKAQIAANDLDTKEEIEAAVRKGVTDLNANLTEDEIQQIIDVMVKIKAMGIDFNVLAEQADDLYAKYADQIKAGTFDINDLSMEDLGIGKMITNAVGNFFKSAADAISGFFKSIFKK
ncbi:MAG TPA: DUF1002 domain-containing protein [Lachnospiraceae bacterium]|jgi:uncharacterized protein YpuA (DUF1002 family)|nr:DUF1002 domain-containing protein [Lachnospiraceae bacterium]